MPRMITTINNSMSVNANFLMTSSPLDLFSLDPSASPQHGVFDNRMRRCRSRRMPVVTSIHEAYRDQHRYSLEKSTRSLGKQIYEMSVTGRYPPAALLYLQMSALWAGVLENQSCDIETT